MKPLNVAYVALAPFISGSEKSLQLMLSSVRSLGVNAILIAPENSPLHKWAKNNDIPSYPCELILFSWRHLLPWFIDQVRLLSILFKHKTDIIHSNQIWSLPPIQIPARILRIKRVCHFRDPVDQSTNWWLKDGVELSLSISGHIESSLTEHVPAERSGQLATIINPIQINTGVDQSNLDNQMLDSRKTLGLNDSQMIYGYIGQVTPVKGVIEIIKAFSEIKTQEEICLLIAGEDTSPEKQYIKACKRLVDELNLGNKVVFLGYLTDVSVFYNAIDIAVVNSLEEPLGRVPLEAGAYFKPSIATRVGGLPETIIDNKTGWLINQGDIDALTRAMQQAISLNTREFGINAREYVETVSDPQRYASKILELYEGLRGKKSS